MAHFILPCKEKTSGPIKGHPMIQKTPAGVGIAWTRRGQARGQELRSTSTPKWDLSDSDSLGS